MCVCQVSDQIPDKSNLRGGFSCGSQSESMRIAAGAYIYSQEVVMHVGVQLVLQHYPWAGLGAHHCVALAGLELCRPRCLPIPRIPPESAS